MHLVDEADAVPVRSRDELIAYFEHAGKPAPQWRVGTEHELVGVVADSGEAPPYDGPHGIGALFAKFAARGGEPVEEAGHTIALSRADAQLTIEPGGQFELAARPVVDDRELVTDLDAYRAATRAIGEGWRARMGKHYPAMSLVKVAGLLEPGALVEIEGVAMLP